MRRTLGFATALLLAALPLRAQAPGGSHRAPLSLAEARNQARLNSPELVAAREAVTTAGAWERQAGALPNPMLSFSREQTSRDGETNWQSIVALDQPLEVGGQRGARRRVAERQRAVAEARLAGAAAQVDLQVTRSYALAVAAHWRARLALVAAEAFDEAERVSAARLEAGDVSGYQHRRLQLEAARYTALRLETQVAQDNTLGVLASLIGSTGTMLDDTTVLTDSLTPAPLTLSVDSLVSLALTNRPELRVALLEADAATAEVGLADAERIPTPVLTGGFKSERLPTGVTISGFVAGLSLPVPLWDRRSGAVEASRAEVARRTADAAIQRRDTEREVRNAHAAHQALAAQLDALRAQLGERAMTARQAADTAYAEGEISLLEWLDSVRAYHEAAASYAGLWAEYIARRAALERATGASLL